MCPWLRQATAIDQQPNKTQRRPSKAQKNKSRRTKGRNLDMRTHAQAVVIGGGLIGCSILYHLAKFGWSDVVLLERNELTSGSTWHAAANIHGLHDSTNISRLQHYTMALYKELEIETGRAAASSSGLALPRPDRSARASAEAAGGQGAALQDELLRGRARRGGTAAPAGRFDGIRCIMYEPEGGNVDPSASPPPMPPAPASAAPRSIASPRSPPPKRSRMAAGSCARRRATSTPNGVINAAGLWGREVAAMAGLQLPLIPTEHQYFVTETIAEIAAMGRRLPSVADRDGEYYLRQEGLGLLIGAYERKMKFWAEDGTPLDFGTSCFPTFSTASRRICCARSRAFRQSARGGQEGDQRADDLVARQRRAVRAGARTQQLFLLQRHHSRVLAVGRHGQAGSRVDDRGRAFARHVRLGHGAFRALGRQGFHKARVQDQYSHRFKIHFPNEERAAGRPVRTRPAYDMQKQMGAVFGLNFGWEHPLWFAAEGEPRARRRSASSARTGGAGWT